jgi:hypothetical protein
MDNSKNHRVIKRTKTKQQNYFNGVSRCYKHNQFEYSDTDDDEVVTKKKIHFKIRLKEFVFSIIKLDIHYYV